MDLRNVWEVGLIGLRSEDRGTGASRLLCRFGQLAGGWGRVLRWRGQPDDLPRVTQLLSGRSRILRPKPGICGSGHSLREASCAE